MAAGRVSRRAFLATGAMAAGVSGASTLAFAAEGEGDSVHLPPAIAALKSLRDAATPITKEERAARIEKARRLMANRKMDAIFVSAGTSLRYFVGVNWWQSERMFGFVLPAKGEPFFVCPAFEEERAREQIARGPVGEKADVRTWQEDESPSLRVKQGLADRGLTGGVVGVEDTVPYFFSYKLAEQGLRLTTAMPVTAGCRMIKSEHELALMRLASKVSLMAYEAAYRSMHEGMTGDEFAGLVDAGHARMGFRGGADVLVGKWSALPHGTIEPQVIREGTILLMDGGCSVEGYASDISRTFVLGKVPVTPAGDKMKQVFDVVKRAQSAALATAKPGVECQAVDAAARKVISDAGFGPDYAHFTHRVGHGMGMDGHEWTYLVRGNQTLLEKDMMFSDEPGVYLRGEFGVRLEDDLHVTEAGAELLTPQSESLEKPF